MNNMILSIFFTYSNHNFIYSKSTTDTLLCSLSQGRTETTAGSQAKANFGSVWTLFRLACLVGAGPLKLWATGHCPNANRLSSPLF